ncbi:hypothetical protein KIPB_000679 [Kipferlia bialata]|uniref:Uncharacterized protein n=1 Tax=Kipferlia bialata TaxID=797122 RepID=A0A9K3GDM6_9EUKA|nr:hypothetical protein KIPB_000679 [Kipferlia bialata]|eukprot:g679.t1
MPSKDLYGTALAERLAAALEKAGTKGEYLSYIHRDYCGHGLQYKQGSYELMEVYDGYPSDTIETWHSKRAFVSFFADQSDLSCSGADQKGPKCFSGGSWYVGNQRLTRERFEEFIKKH